MTLRRVTEDDLDEILGHNNAAVPAVNALTRPDLEWFAEHADTFLVVGEPTADISGFLIGLGPGLAYDSTNYRWFSDRYPAFLYVDRVVVAAGGRSSGVGTRLYDAFAERGRAADVPVMLAEVNIRPRNEGSLRFHDRHDFVSVGEQDTEGGAKRVTLLEKRLSTRSS